jgi:hypothetical protein
VNVEQIGVRLLGMGFHDIHRLILSHLWAPLLRASHIPFPLFVFEEYFFQSLYYLSIYFACVTKLKSIRGTKKEIYRPKMLYLG